MAVIRCRPHLVRGIPACSCFALLVPSTSRTSQLPASACRGNLHGSLAMNVGFVMTAGAGVRQLSSFLDNIAAILMIRRHLIRANDSLFKNAGCTWWSSSSSSSPSSSACAHAGWVIRHCSWAFGDTTTTMMWPIAGVLAAARCSMRRGRGAGADLLCERHCWRYRTDSTPTRRPDRPTGCAGRHRRLDQPAAAR